MSRRRSAPAWLLRLARLKPRGNPPAGLAPGRTEPPAPRRDADATGTAEAAHGR